MRWKANVKKNSFRQNKCYKGCTFFLLQASTHHSFTFNSQLLHELKHKFHLSKTVCGIFHFRFHLIFIKVYIFVQQKAPTLDFKRHDSFKKKTDPKMNYLNLEN